MQHPTPWSSNRLDDKTRYQPTGAKNKQSKKLVKPPITRFEPILAKIKATMIIRCKSVKRLPLKINIKKKKQHTTTRSTGYKSRHRPSAW
jgi:hypothetical protein